MKVFVAGATGVIGRALVPRLVDAGHVVVGMSNDVSRNRLLSALGARPAAARRAQRPMGRQLWNASLRSVPPFFFVSSNSGCVFAWLSNVERALHIGAPALVTCWSPSPCA